jgi:hypothetical protein
MTLVLDAGAFIAIERGSRDIIALLKAELQAGRMPVTHGGIVGQVWRGSARQAALARLLPALEIVPLDEQLGRLAGALLRDAGTKDVLDAALVLLASDGDTILTADVADLARLARAAAVQVDLVRV